LHNKKQLVKKVKKMPEGINKTSFGFYVRHSLKAEEFARVNSWVFLGFAEAIVTYFD